jgi:hypothetical protein
MPNKKLLTIISTFATSFVILSAFSLSSINSLAQSEPNVPGFGLIPTYSSSSSSVSLSTSVSTSSSSSVSTISNLSVVSSSTSSDSSSSSSSSSSSNSSVSSVSSNSVVSSSTSSDSEVLDTPVGTIRTGGFPIFLLLAVPLVLVLAYQYKYIRESGNKLNTEEKDITNKDI